ncbi:MAG TPA: CsbD family protein [Longimicrobium sp.]|nr:CsbD family protein [Longimicrobium sp.]
MADHDLMNDGLGNQLEGQGKDLKGRVKDAVGGLTGDESLQGEGKLDRLKGKIQDTFGKGEEDVGRKL